MNRENFRRAAVWALSIFILSVSSKSFADEFVNRATDLFSAIRDSSLQTHSQVYDFCLNSNEVGRNRLTGQYYEKLKPFDSQNRLLSEQQIEKFFTYGDADFLDNERRIDLSLPWLTTTSPSLNHRFISYEINVNRYFDGVTNTLNKKWELLTAALEHPLDENFLPPMVANQTSFKAVNEFFNKKSPSETDSISKYAPTAMCLYYAPYDVVACQNALKKMIDISKRSPEGDIIGGALIREVFENPAFIPGVARLALKIDRQIRSGNIDGNLFDDAVQSFRETGSTVEVAEDRAWKLLTTYAIKGAEISWYDNYTIPRRSRVLSLALGTIALGTQVLDSYLFKSNRSYSYPKEMGTSCDSGKPYHFWMAAALARYAVKTGSSYRGAVTAAYLLDVAYQLYGHDRSGALYQQEGSGTYKARMDITYAAAGALSAVEKLRTNQFPKFQFDRSLVNLIKASATSRPSLTSLPEWMIGRDYEMSGVGQFDKLIRPGTLVRQNFKSMKH